MLLDFRLGRNSGKEITVLIHTFHIIVGCRVGGQLFLFQIMVDNFLDGCINDGKIGTPTIMPGIPNRPPNRVMEK